jgi:uncharacterized protein
MKYGLTDETVAKLQGVLARYPQVEKATLYGSRAKGNFKTGSDIDLTLHGQSLDHDLHCQIAAELDDLNLPYTIDLSIFHQLTHRELIEHIQRVGQSFYQRT